MIIKQFADELSTITGKVRKCYAHHRSFLITHVFSKTEKISIRLDPKHFLIKFKFISNLLTHE